MNPDKLKQIQNVCSGIDNQFITKYRPIKMLSSGSYGTTFLVEYQEKKYVVKNQNYETFIDLSILMEANILITLKNIPEIINFEGICYPRKLNAIMIILEAMDGDISMLNQNNLDTVFLSEQLFHQITRSLCVFQNNSLIHYDIKRKNLLYKKTDTAFKTDFISNISQIGDRPNIIFKLADFGLAKPNIPKIETRTFFTPIYKAPEYFEFFSDSGVKNNPYVADIWSFAVTIIEFLIDEYLFYGDDDETTMELILENSIIDEEEEDSDYEIYLDEFIESYNDKVPKIYINVERILSMKLSDTDFNRIPMKLIKILSDMLHLHPKYRPSASDILKNYFNEEIDVKLLEQQINKKYDRKTDISVEIISKSIIYYLMNTVFADGNKDKEIFIKKMNITILIAIEIYTRFLFHYQLQGKIDEILYPIAALLIAVNYTDVKIDLFNYFNSVYDVKKLSNFSNEKMELFIEKFYKAKIPYEEKVNKYLRSIFKEELLFAQKIILKNVDFLTFIPSLNPVIESLFEKKISISNVHFSKFGESIEDWWK